jgi:DNA topoisomerase I
MKNYKNYILEKESQKVYSEKDIEKRWKKKKEHLKTLSGNIRKLKLRIDRDLSSDDEKTRIIACIVKIMEITGERVGNDISSKMGNFGISNLRKNHITISGDQVTLKYTGKSNVKQEKTFKHSKVAKILKELKKIGDDIFKTSDGISIKNKQVNRYLSDFNITSKDLRGFKCNKMMVDELNKVGKVKDEKERKKIFNEKLRKVADEIGHTAATLRKHYLLPSIESNFYNHGSIGRVQKI